MLKKFVLPLALAVSLLPAREAAAAKYEPNTAILEREVEITADTVNIRSGPGGDYPVTGTAAKGDVLQVMGMLGDWYVVCLPDGAVGVTPAEYTRVVALGEVFLPEGGGDQAATAEDDSDQAALFALVNADRVRNKLPPFEWDERLNKVAQIKADDMVKNGYLGHDSPLYGTPFKMLKTLDVAYKSASENLVAAGSVQNAHLATMARPANRSNILNTYFTKMGVGVANSDEYGKIVVQMFIYI